MKNYKSIRIESDTIKQVSDKYNNFNAGVSHILAAWFPLREIALKSIRGNFNIEEMIYFISLYYNHRFEPDHEKLDVVVARIENSCCKDCKDEKIKISLLGKILALHPVELLILVEFACVFWEKKEMCSVEDYVEYLL
jgi:hypothetical protein